MNTTDPTNATAHSPNVGGHSHVDVARLRDAAQAATGGQWAASYDDLTEYWQVRSSAGAMLVDVGARNNRDNAQFIAAANPTVVLALLDRLEELEADSAKSLTKCEDYAERKSDEIFGLQNRLEELEGTMRRVRDLTHNSRRYLGANATQLMPALRQALEGDPK